MKGWGALGRMSMELLAIRGRLLRSKSEGKQNRALRQRTSKFERRTILLDALLAVEVIKVDGEFGLRLGAEMPVGVG